MGSFIFYGAVAFMLYRAFDRHLYKWISIVAAVGLILVIGTSRVYLGVHYPSDIIGGYSAGGAWLIVSILVYSYLAERYKWWNQNEKKA
ncbi:phosphatase PAP2 family protein [Rossellomorea sp. H39__3]